MPILLILSLDPSLEREVETCLEDALVLSLESPDAVQSARSTLDHRPVLFVDTDSFQPPTGLDADICCIGSAGPAGLPLLERPLREMELRSMIAFLSQEGGSASPASHQLLPSPFAEFQRDAVHDLNNQFTTLQGNLMLLCDESDDPSLADLSVATQKAIQIVQWMEWLGAGEFSAQTFDLHALLVDFAPMFFRLRGRTTRFEVVSTDAGLSMRKDPQRLIALLIVLIDALPGSPEICELSSGTLEGSLYLRCSSKGPAPEVLETPERAEPWLAALSAELIHEPGQWTLLFQ